MTMYTMDVNKDITGNYIQTLSCVCGHCCVVYMIHCCKSRRGWGIYPWTFQGEGDGLYKNTPNFREKNKFINNQLLKMLTK